MSIGTTASNEPPILGTDGNDAIAVEASVSFQWVPATGNAGTVYTGWQDPLTGEGFSFQTTGPSTASSYITFNGVASSEPFESLPQGVRFTFSDGNIGYLSQSDLAVYSFGWKYDPTTGALDPRGMFLRDDWMWTWFSPYETAYYANVNLGGGTVNGEVIHAEMGQWQLAPQIHNVDVFGGAGNDTILGGQGTETLDGGGGNDLIRASVGNDLLRGGAGDDKLHGGIGTQTLMGGAGNDTLWGGSGIQFLEGGDGSDIIHAGSGQQTLMGGAGNDTLWGGSGIQFLQGGNGSDVLHAGIGNETLSGGSGRDTFVFSTTSRSHDVITDFRPGQDIIKIASDFRGLMFVRPQDLSPHISADRHGDAMLTVGSRFSIVLQHVQAQRVELHPADFFKAS